MNGFNCPACRAELRETQHERIPVLECPDEHGIWLTGDALHAAVHSTEEDRPVEEENEMIAGGPRKHMPVEHVIKCPQCDEEMAKAPYGGDSGIVMDVCRNHGIWLDHKELQHIEAWYEGSTRVAAQEASQWKSRLDEIEEDSERRAAVQVGSPHVRGVSRVASGLAWWWYRRDNR